MTRFLSQGPLNTLSRIDSSCNRALMDSCHFCPFRNCVGHAIEGNKTIAPHIVLLLFLGCPSAVSHPFIFDTLIATATGVATRIINAVNTVFIGWPLAHVFEKIREIIPPRAYSYASAAIVAV